MDTEQHGQTRCTVFDGHHAARWRERLRAAHPATARACTAPAANVGTTRLPEYRCVALACRYVASVPKTDDPGTPLGQAIRERREELRMTQDALAEAAGTAPKNIWEIERKRANPTYSTLLALANALHVPAEALTIRARVIDGDRDRQGQRDGDSPRS
jgi:DNA-binding XRE family transcriptional regulator